MEKYTLHEPKPFGDSWYIHAIPDIASSLLFLLPDGTIDEPLHGREHFPDKKSALKAIDDYNNSFVEPKPKGTLEGKFKLLEPQKMAGNDNRHFIRTACNKGYLGLNGNIYSVEAVDTTFHTSDVLFKSYNSALFAKLRYERLNREK